MQIFSKTKIPYRYVIALAIILISQSINSFGQSFLKVKDKLIVNEQGEKVILRGMGLGGWMLQEGYMFRLSNLGQQYKIREGIQDLVGAEKAAQFYDKWLKNHTRKIDIDSMASWGFNSIRLPIHFDLYTLPVDQEPVVGQNTWIEKGFAMTDSLLSWCKANKMYLILDLHAAPGGQGNDLPISDRHPDKPSLWQSEANKQKTIALWRKLAERYVDEPGIGGYDIINEPNWGFEKSEDFRGTEETKNEPLRKLMMDITTAIRQVDKKHIIIIEGNGFGNNYRGVLPAWDDNMVLSFHKYGNFNTTSAIQSFLDLREKYNIPLWLGESGENSNTWFTEAIGLVEKNDIGWAWWQEKKMGINNPLEIKITPAYQKLLDYWSKKGPKPSEAEAWATLNELLENLKLENNSFHKDVTDAMFRQVSSAEAKPFKKHLISKNYLLNAVDFDLGRQRVAYFDKDSASYQYTPGVKTTGNRGRAYRNDGVDIKEGKEGFYVFSMEDEEWLQYTIDVKKSGKYSFKFLVSSEIVAGRLAIYADGDIRSTEVNIPITGNEEKWQTVEVKGIRLHSGINQLRIVTEKGGCNLKTIQISK
ncbi:MAG: glycosyl hydrolase family 5 [Sphingobacteriales bacterium]|nr:glycosyl hydrolase family 5 [Sphingobacteriales bacterium]